MDGGFHKRHLGRAPHGGKRNIETRSFPPISAEVGCSLETSFSQFLPHGAPHRRRDVSASEVFAQRFVDQRLVVAAPHVMGSLAELIENAVVQPDGYPGLAWLGWYNRATPALAEIVFALHRPFS